MVREFWLNKREIEWLKTNFPSLKLDRSGRKISGIIKFAMDYDQITQKYEIYYELNIPPTDKNIVSDEYEIEIKPKITDVSILPEVKEVGGRIKKFAKDKTKFADLHISEDNKVCLCSPLIEAEEFPSGFNLEIFFNRILIPFFCGHSYREKNNGNSPPWGEYSHNITGLFESYYDLMNQTDDEKKIKIYIEKLIKQPQYNVDILRKVRHTKICCFCGGRHNANRHGRAYSGLIKFKNDKMQIN